MDLKDLPQLELSKLLEQFIYNPKSPMIFNTGFFLLLFLFFLLFYSFIRNNIQGRILYLTLFSFYFYYKSSGLFFGLLLLSTLIDFYLAKWIDETTSKKFKKSLLVISLLSNLGLLAYFKYTNFFIDTFNGLAGSGIQPIAIFLPIGISFYTFQTLSYTIDVYRGHLKPLNNLLDFAFFVSFFPQLVAGPIVRASDFIPQIRKSLAISKDDITRAVLLIGGGLFKKAVISDYISINFVDRVFDNPALYSGTENLLAVYGYALQIYCDFSGYSDIAIGIALLLGFKLPPNFLSPYQSTSITEFWRRWHISLSSWLRDYLYISLGGNRSGKFRQYLNLGITMLLGGLWHGASWQFVIWGGLHGMALAIDKVRISLFPKNSNLILKYTGFVLTFHFVCFCWIFFRADSFTTAQLIMNKIAFNFKLSLLPQILINFKEVFVLLAIGYFLHFLPDKLSFRFERIRILRSVVVQSFVLAFMIWLVIQVKSSEIQPFIYFQF